jgi:hypothetical protein
MFEKLCKLQKRAARTIVYAKYDIPSLQLLKKTLVGCLFKID